MKKQLRIPLAIGASSCFMFAGIGCLIALASSETQRSSRAPASIESANLGAGAKSAVLEGAARSKRLRSIGKGNSSIEIEINAPGKGEVNAGSVLNLEASISAKEDLAGLKYVWLLPKDGVSVVSGQVEGDLGSLAESDTTTVYLSVSSDTPENRRIHLHVYRVVDGENRGQMAQYNTVDQEKIERHADAKAESLRQSAEALGTTQKLIQ
jgi:hypothetical protein